jgi:hypothetical protein
MGAAIARLRDLEVLALGWVKVGGLCRGGSCYR